MFAAIYFPDFALQCVLRHEPELRERALSVVDGRLPARIRQLTPAARARGVAIGMTTTQALGRCPALHFRTVGQSLLEPASALLLQVAEGFSPWLEATGEGIVTLEWRGECASAELLGKAGAATSVYDRAREIVRQFARHDFAAQVGVAATPDLALLAAHARRRAVLPACLGGRPAREEELGRDTPGGRLEACPTTREPAVVSVVGAASEFLAPLAIEALAGDGETAHSTEAAEKLKAARADIFRRLHRWGIHTLGAFAALPREQVVARLGGLGGELWDRAAGVARRPLRLVRAPEVFAEAMELEHEVETLEPLLFILRRFLDQLALRLEAAYRVAATLELRLHFREGAPHLRELRIPAPTSDVDLLFRVLSTHLEGVSAATPIIGLALSALPARPERQQGDLFENGVRDPNKFHETLARLHALLGNDRVGTPVAEDTWRPDAFHLEMPRFDGGSPGAGSPRLADAPCFAGSPGSGRAGILPEGADTLPARSKVRKTPHALPALNDVRGGAQKTAHGGWNTHPPQTPAPAAPLQRFRPPLHANVQDDAAGRPLRVFSEKAFGEVTDCRGPWLGSGDWWLPERAWERIEWDVQVGDTCYRLAHQAGAWFLDGAYE